MLVRSGENGWAPLSDAWSGISKCISLWIESKPTHLMNDQDSLSISSVLIGLAVT